MVTLAMRPIDLVQELAIGDIAAGRALARVLEQRDERQDEQEDDDPKGEIAEVRIHLLASSLRERGAAGHRGAGEGANAG